MTAQTTFFKKTPERPYVQPMVRGVGVIVALIGALIVVSWYAHWQRLIQILPGTAPMKFNSAWCFVLTGLGLFLLTTKHRQAAPWLAGIVVAFTGLTLAEYLVGKNFGIDELFFKSYVHADTVYPGRMSPLASVCFIVGGASVVSLGLKRTWAHRLTAAGMLSCMVLVVAVVALFGFAFGIQSAYGWGSYSRMAVNTAVTFLLLGSGVLLLAWQTAERERFNFLRWLPITGSVTLMVMVAFVSAVNMAELKRASFWRKHTIDVILSAQAFQDNFTAMQLGMRGYVTLHDTNGLASYHKSLAQVPVQLEELKKETKDNTEQQTNSKELGRTMDEMFAYDVEVIGLYEAGGFPAVSKKDATGEGRRIFADAIAAINQFSKTEQKLLETRGAREQADYHNAARLLVLGSVLAALLLVLANVMASRELRERLRVELRLREVTMLQNAILNSANYAILALDPNGTVRTFNPAAERMLGYSSMEVVGKATPMLWHDPADVAIQAEDLSRKLGRTIQPGIGVIIDRPVQVEAIEFEAQYTDKGGRRFPALISLTALADQDGATTGFLGIIADITERKKNEEEREKLIGELQRALTEVKTLSGLIPICGWCKNVRSDKGYWQSVEQYVSAYTGASFTHGICPGCSAKVKAELAERRQHKVQSPA